MILGLKNVDHEDESEDEAVEEAEAPVPRHL
jgi:hypothetical protein